VLSRAAMTRWLALGISLATALAGCTCGSVAPRVSGPHPYVRCALVTPRELDRTLGSTRVVVAGRDATITGNAWPLRVALTRGPAPFSSEGQAEAAALRAAEPHVIVVQGGLDSGEGDPFLREVGALGVPTLVLSGGRDHVRTSMLGADSLILVDGLDRIRIGALTLVPLPGVFEGRYALDEDSCGFDAEDLSRRSAGLGERAPGEARILVSFQAPRARGVEGDVEVPALLDFERAIGSRFGLHAWPDCAGVDEHRACARRASGMPTVSSEGDVVPARPMLLLVAEDGAVTPG
jgi:hypothetical protein